MLLPSSDSTPHVDDDGVAGRVGDDLLGEPVVAVLVGADLGEPQAPLVGPGDHAWSCRCSGGRSRCRRDTISSRLADARRRQVGIEHLADPAALEGEPDPALAVRERSRSRSCRPRSTSAGAALSGAGTRRTSRVRPSPAAATARASAVIVRRRCMWCGYPISMAVPSLPGPPAGRPRPRAGTATPPRSGCASSPAPTDAPNAAVPRASTSGTTPTTRTTSPRTSCSSPTSSTTGWSPYRAAIMAAAGVMQGARGGIDGVARASDADQEPPREVLREDGRHPALGANPQIALRPAVTALARGSVGS